MPHDIGLVGFNDEPILNLVSPSISSVEMPSFELGKVTAKLFIEVLHNIDDDMSSIEIAIGVSIYYYKKINLNLKII